jgi:hypothetical protein
VDGGGQVGGDVRRQVAQLRHLALDVLRGDDRGLVTAHWPAAGEHLEDDHAEREDVGTRVDGVCGERLLRRHVLRGAHDHAGARQPAVELAGDLELGDAEVEQLDERLLPRIHGDHHIVGLEIAVDDAGAMRRLHALQHLQRVVERVVVGEALPGAVQVLVERLQGAPLQVLHDDERQAGGRLVDVADPHHVRALDLGGDARLLEEPLDQALPARQLGMEELQGHRGPEDLVARLVDAAHTAVADEADQSVLVVDDLSDLGAHRGS